MIAYTLSTNTLSIHIMGESRPRVINTSDKGKIKKIVDSIKEVNQAKKENSLFYEEYYENFLALISPVRYIAFKDSRFKLTEDNQLFLAERPDTPIFGYMGERIVEFVNNDLPVDYLIQFWINCLDNPKPGAIDELFEFLEENNYPITEDGCFIGYKKVRSISSSKKVPSKFEGLRVDKQGNVRDSKGHFVGNPLRQEYIDFVNDVNEAQFVDSHSGTIKQSIGDVVSIPREDCDFDRNNTCSAGLHIGSYNYSKNFSGDTFIYVKVNPKNVVAVPPQYDNGKLRCCEYEIVGLAEHENELDVATF